MRQAHLRTLATRGIEVRGVKKFQGLEVYEASDGRGSELLIFSGAIFGPSWASIGFALEQFGIPHTLLNLGRTFLLADDTHELRNFLGQVFLASKKSFREEILIQDVGFMVSDVRKKFDPRVLIAPTLMLAVTVLALLFQPFEPKVGEGTAESIIQITCALDLTEVEFRSWIQEQVQKADDEAVEIVIRTDLGELSLDFQQALGSTQLVHGSLNCQDGRTRELRFRTDSLQGGSLVELGKKLDP